MTTYNQCIANTWKFSIFIFPMGRIRVCEIRFASTDVIYGNPYPVCKKRHVFYPKGSDFFLISPQKYILWHSLEMPYWGTSNEYSKHVFMEKYEKCYLVSLLTSIWNYAGRILTGDSNKNMTSIESCHLALKAPFKIVACDILWYFFRGLVNPCPAEPRYTLPLQTV